MLLVVLCGKRIAGWKMKKRWLQPEEMDIRFEESAAWA